MEDNWGPNSAHSSRGNGNYLDSIPDRQLFWYHEANHTRSSPQGDHALAGK